MLGSFGTSWAWLHSTGDTSEIFLPLLDPCISWPRKVVAYFSHTFTHPESKYCVTRLELLSFWAFNAFIHIHSHFIHISMGRDSCCMTMPPLPGFSTSKNLEGQLALWLMMLQEYDCCLLPMPLPFPIDLVRKMSAITAWVRMSRMLWCWWWQGFRTLQPIVAACLDWQRLQTTTSARTMMRRVSSSLRTKTLPSPGSKPGGGRAETSMTGVSTLDTKTKTLYWHWACLTCRGGLLYHSWQSPGVDRVIFQFLVPDHLYPKQVQFVHGLVGQASYALARPSFTYSPNSTGQVVVRMLNSMSTSVTTALPKRAFPIACMLLHGGSHGTGSSGHLGSFPTTDQGNCYVLVAMDYFTKWPEAYTVLFDNLELTSYDDQQLSLLKCVLEQYSVDVCGHGVESLNALPVTRIRLSLISCWHLCDCYNITLLIDVYSIDMLQFHCICTVTIKIPQCQCKIFHVNTDVYFGDVSL